MSDATSTQPISFLAVEFRHLASLAPFEVIRVEKRVHKYDDVAERRCHKMNEVADEVLEPFKHVAREPKADAEDIQLEVVRNVKTRRGLTTHISTGKDGNECHENRVLDQLFAS